MFLACWKGNLKILCDAGPGLAQTRDSPETVTGDGRDVSRNAGAGNAGTMRANALWNNQCALLAEEDDWFRWELQRKGAKFQVCGMVTIFVCLADLHCSDQIHLSDSL